MLHTSRFAQTALLLAFLLLLSGCGKNKVTKANYDKITDGMSLQDVEALVGKGTKDTGDGSNVAAQVGVAIDMAPRAVEKDVDYYVWEKGNKSFTVTFKSNKVMHKFWKEQ
jgi:hypothetical protein